VLFFKYIFDHWYCILVETDWKMSNQADLDNYSFEDLNAEIEQEKMMKYDD